ncbi:phage tail protein [Lentzea sp. NPDC005914]|uniref:phage tail protein n=1 Tax=Lentzea sp. NPDC005914 TaxID=3154572 RepID=UPI003410ED5A
MTTKPARTVDPPFTGRFKLTIDGLEIGAFTEISGLSVQIDVEELAEGGQNQYTHKLPGRMKWPNLVFKRGITDTDNLFAWFAKCSGDGLAAADEKVERHHGAITLLDAKGKAVRTWNFVDAFPVKWSGPRLAASSRDAAVEELEVCHCGFKAER